MKQTCWISIVTVVVAGICAWAGAESASLLFEKGIYTEETVGDLDAAIQIYEKIVEDADANRPYVAHALFRLGMCYLKKDREQEAAAAFRQLMEDFPEQAELVAEARKHIPGEPFPEFAGCRVKETVTLRIEKPEPEWSQPDGARTETIYEHGVVDIVWQVDPKTIEKVRSFAVGMRRGGADFDDQESYMWQAVNLPATTRSTTYGRTWPQVTSGPVSLSPGDYVVHVCAYDAEKSKLNGTNLIGAATARLTVKPMLYTQIAINDVRPDGTIRGRNIIQEPNRSGKTVTTRHFISSDFAHVTSMSDDQGRPMQFTTKHEGNIYRYNVTLNKPVPPGEPILYASEGTMTGLVKRVAGAADEVKYSMMHWPSSGQSTRRIEVYRLPEGAALLETMPADMAQRTRHGRTELFVEKIIPAGGSITTAFRYRLSGVELAQEKPLQLNPAPWVDGEVMRLNLRTKSGVEFGTLIYTADLIDVAGTSAWRVESFQVVTVGNTDQFSRVDAERDTFAPISGWTKNWMGDFRGTFGKTTVEVASNVNGRESRRNVQVNRVAYDNEQALHLIRRLPLEEGYRASFPILPLMGGAVVECRIDVTGKEEATVRAGTFDCYRTNLAIYVGEVKGLEHTLWFSADEHRYLVKYDAGTAVMALTEAGRRKDGPARFEDSELGIALTAPAGWYFLKDPAPGQYKLSLRLLSPELETWSVLAAAERGSQETSARQVAEGDLDVVGGLFQDYAVRPDSWADLNVAGLPTTSYIADYEDKGKDMVEYRTYMLGKSMVYWFVFRIEKDQFEANSGAFDSIVASFRAENEVVGTVRDADKRAAESLSSEGWQLWRQRKLEDAEQMFQKAVQTDPTNVNAWNGLGWSQFNQGKPLNARASFQRCLEVDPEHVAALNGLGWITKGQGETDEAIAFWERAVEAAPGATAALNGLATTYMELEQYDKAAKYYQMWLEVEPNNPDARRGVDKATASIREQ